MQPSPNGGGAEELSEILLQELDSEYLLAFALLMWKLNSPKL
jgi:hypothetical protein